MLRDVSVEEVVEFALACERQLLAAQSGAPGISAFAPLSGVKQTSGERVENDTNDPDRTCNLAASAAISRRVW